MMKTRSVREDKWTNMPCGVLGHEGMCDLCTPSPLTPSRPTLLQWGLGCPSLLMSFNPGHTPLEHSHKTEAQQTDMQSGVSLGFVTVLPEPYQAPLTT